MLLQKRPMCMTQTLSGNEEHRVKYLRFFIYAHFQQSKKKNVSNPHQKVVQEYNFFSNVWAALFPCMAQGWTKQAALEAYGSPPFLPYYLNSVRGHLCPCSTKNIWGWGSSSVGRDLVSVHKVRGPSLAPQTNTRQLWSQQLGAVEANTGFPYLQKKRTDI